MTRATLVLLLILGVPVQTGLARRVSAVQPAGAPELAPGTQYDPRIPTLKSVLGHEVGEEVTPPDGIVDYLQALAAAAPDRTRLVKYAETWERRPLYVLLVSSAERIARLDDIKRGMARLADPRGLEAAERDTLLKELPVVTWLMHAVHGNEISSSDAALAEAYHLLAARSDGGVDTILRESIVIIDPLQNPDGRARFVFQNLQGRAATPDPEPASAEHDEPWPGGRANHYLFDMNRDWFAQSQPETIGRARLYLEWFPQVVVDLHEMGGNSTYYFAPPASPLNPHITKAQQDWFDLFGRANANRFDERGFAYFIREVYDSFYPGYGESWPIFHGAVGMTYEQASARGLVFRRADDTLLTYRDAVVHHFTAAVTTALTAARHRERLLRDFVEYRQSAIREGETGPVREYLIPPGHDPSRSARLARLLVAQGIEVKRAEEPVKHESRTLPAGTFIVPVAQPASRLLRNLLEPHIAMDDAFMAEQERRRNLRMGDQIYDVTAWSLPAAFDVEVVPASRPSPVRSSPVTREPAQPPAATLARARVGYLIPWGSGAAAAVAEALQAGIRVQSADRFFAIGGRRFEAGTAIVRTSVNGPDLPERLGRIVAGHGAEAVPIDTAYVEAGMSLGSGDVVKLKAPNVIMAWDTPTQSLSAGWARYVLERRFGQPVTIVRTSSLGRVDLRRFDVLVLPSGGYGPAIGGDALRRLKDWISAGGTLVTIAEASRWATRANVELLATQTELRDGRPDVEPSGDDAKRGDRAAPDKPFDFDKAIQPDRERPESQPGAFLRVVLDRHHWLTAGHDEEIQAIVEGNRIFSPMKLDKGRNVGVYAKKDRLLGGGHVWPEAQEPLAQKAFLMHQPMGQGHVIAFSEDPNFRAFAEATELLFMNAVLLGPAH